MANTTNTTLNYDFVPYDNTAFQQVFSGRMTFHTGWSHIEFSTPFTYDGTSNIVITVNDHTFTYSSGCNFRVHTAYGLARSNYRDSYAFDPATPTTIGSGYSLGYRNDMRLYYDDNAK